MPNGVTLNIQNKDGEAEKIQAQYLIACDGGNSSVRSYPQYRL